VPKEPLYNIIMGMDDEQLFKVRKWLKIIRKSLLLLEGKKPKSIKVYFWRIRKRGGKLPRPYTKYDKEVYHHCGELISDFVIAKNGTRYCRRCVNERNRKYRARKRGIV
jgi:hypothetical protein